MRFLTRPPGPALAPFVETIWYFEAELPHAREHILPLPRAQMLINLDEDEMRTYRDGAVRRTGGAVLEGPPTRGFGIDTAEQREIVGVTFRAGGSYPFFLPPPSALADDGVDLGDLWGRDGACLRERLLEAPTSQRKLDCVARMLLARAVRPLDPPEWLAPARRRGAAGVRVADVADALGFSVRTLHRRFTERMGVSPKRFARMERLGAAMRLAAQAPEKGWAEVAVEAGYFDQSHLLRDLKEIGGLRASAFRPRSAEDANHIVLSDPSNPKDEVS